MRTTIYFTTAFFYLLFVSFYTRGQVITTYAGNGVAGYTGNGGAAVSAALNTPTGVAIDKQNNLYIADGSNNVIRKVSPSGVISLFAGNTAFGYMGDNGPATSAELAFPVSVAVDDSGNVYIADQYNYALRKVNTAGIITTVAGNGVTGTTTDSVFATAASLNFPTSVAVDHTGNIYIADRYAQRVFKVGTSGIIYSIAGTGTPGYTGDEGPAALAQLNTPASVAVDKAGNIYIADAGNYVIRKIDTAGIISTVAGGASVSADSGSALAHPFLYPEGVAVDSAGNVYISDESANRVFKVDTAGIITTLAGNGFGSGTDTGGYSGDNGLADSAELYGPLSIAVDGYGIYIADMLNNRIRRVSPGTPSAVPEVPASQSVSIYPNPTTGGSFIITLPLSAQSSAITVYDLYGRVVAAEVAPANTTWLQLTLKNATPGTYMIKVENSNGYDVRKLVVE